MEKIKMYKKAMKNEEILEGTIILTQYDKELESDIVVMDLDGMKGVIQRKDLDFQVEWKSLVGLIGMKVGFIIKEIDEEKGIIFCSRKEAQEKMQPVILKKLEDGKELEATITGLVRYGAYVEMDGVYGLIENSDFSDDHIKIKDVMKVGDKIKVKLKNISDKKRVTLFPVEKYVLEAVLKFDNFERNQVVLGVINTIKPFGAFVAIAPGLDALCPIPETEEIEEGAKVSFRITQVQEDKGRVRGKILRVVK
jgi:small subunit ribosomal protein S1